MVDEPSGTRVTGHAAPAKVAAAARIGRRAVIASVVSEREGEDREHDHAVHERLIGGIEGQRDLVEVGKAASEAAQNGIEEVVVAIERPGLERRNVERERGDGDAGDEQGADPQRAARKDRRDDCGADASANSPPGEDAPASATRW